MLDWVERLVAVLLDPLLVLLLLSLSFLNLVKSNHKSAGYFRAKFDARWAVTGSNRESAYSLLSLNLLLVVTRPTPS